MPLKLYCDVDHHNHEKNDIKLQRILRNLSKDSIANNDKFREGIIKGLKEIYNSEDNYRHSYSKCFDTVAKLYEQDPENVSNLTQNLKLLLDSEVIFNNPGLHKKIMKLSDHISLDYNRLTFFNEYSHSVKNSIENSEQMLEENMADIRDDIDQVSNDMERVSYDMKNHKFDVMGITTLVLTAFTVVSVNLTVFAGVISSNVPLNKIILLFGLMNAMIISSIFCLYSIIRKIHGDIENHQLYLTIFLNIIFICVIGYFGFQALK